MTVAEKLTTIAENEQKVFDAGYSKGIGESYEQGFADGEKSEHDRFWGAYQETGSRLDYQSAFAGIGWNEETFKPKHGIKPNNTNQMFMEFNGNFDLAEHLENLGVELDTSSSYNANYMFYKTKFTRIGNIDLRSATYSQYLFQRSELIKKIDMVILKDDGTTQVTMWFEKCNALEEIRLAGVIGLNGFDIHWSTKLSEASGLSIINALSTTTTGLSVTLPIAWKERFIEKHGLADFEVYTILARANWTFNWL